MNAVEFNDVATGKPSADFANKVRTEALKRGLLLLTCGVHGNVIRFLSPLTIQDGVFTERTWQAGRGDARGPRRLIRPATTDNRRPPAGRPFAFRGPSYRSKVAKTGAWSDGCSQARAARSTRLPCAALEMSGVAQT